MSPLNVMCNILEFLNLEHLTGLGAELMGNDTNTLAKSNKSSTYSLSFSVMMPFWQSSGNSNSSHLSSVPAERSAPPPHQASWKSTLQTHWSPDIRIIQSPFPLTISEHCIVFLTVPTLLSGSCEACLEASCGGASLLPPFLDALGILEVGGK